MVACMARFNPLPTRIHDLMIPLTRLESACTQTPVVRMPDLYKVLLKHTLLDMKSRQVDYPMSSRESTYCATEKTTSVYTARSGRHVRYINPEDR